MLISVCYHVINVQVTMLLMYTYFAFILLQYSPMAIPDEVFERYFRGWNPWDYPSSPLWLWTPPKIWSSWDFDLRTHGQFATRICVFTRIPWDILFKIRMTTCIDCPSSQTDQQRRKCQHHPLTWLINNLMMMMMNVPSNIIQSTYQSNYIVGGMKRCQHHETDGPSRLWSKQKMQNVLFSLFDISNRLLQSFYRMFYFNNKVCYLKCIFTFDIMLSK